VRTYKKEESGNQSNNNRVCQKLCFFGVVSSSNPFLNFALDCGCFSTYDPPSAKQFFLKLQLFVVVNLPWERENLRKLGADSTDSLPDEETKQKQSQSFM
jgi:hypothetical protein